jgi:hypothetical protein
MIDRIDIALSSSQRAEIGHRIAGPGEGLAVALGVLRTSHHGAGVVQRHRVTVCAAERAQIFQAAAVAQPTASPELFRLVGRDAPEPRGPSFCTEKMGPAFNEDEPPRKESITTVENVPRMRGP